MKISRREYLTESDYNVVLKVLKNDNIIKAMLFFGMLTVFFLGMLVMYLFFELR